MRLSPVDIRQQQFTKKLRGFDPQEVDAFLDDVAGDFETLLREAASLKEQLSGHEERSRGVAETERTLTDTLVTTQRLSDEMRESAKREAELIVREARMNGEKLLEDARLEEAKLRTEIQALKRVRRNLVEELKATFGRYERLLAEDMGSGGPDAERQG